MKPLDLEGKAIEALRNVLKEMPFVAVVEEIKERQESYSAGVRLDREMRLRLPDQNYTLLVETKSSGEPRFARDAVNQLLRVLGALPGSYGVFIAPWISPAAALICREAGVGCVDLAGNCHLAFGTVYIDRAGNPNPFAGKRGLRSLYSPKASRILRVLLCDPRRPWKLQALADEAKVSLGQVHKVKTLLLDKEWLQPTPEGIVLSQPAGLLSEWAENYTFRRNDIRQYYSLQPLGKLENDLATVCASENVRYALAGFSAAARLAPFVRYLRASAYLDEESVTRIAQALNLKEVSSGSNITLWIPYDEGVWYGSEEKDRARVTSPIQTYLDLRKTPARGEEAAEFILKEVMRPRW